jgi:hypothetical protein
MSSQQKLHFSGASLISRAGSGFFGCKSKITIEEGKKVKSSMFNSSLELLFVRSNFNKNI